MGSLIPCRCLIQRASCCITSAGQEQDRRNFSCLRECSSTALTGSILPIHLTDECKYSNIRLRKQPVEGGGEARFRVDFIAECMHVGPAWRRSAGVTQSDTVRVLTSARLDDKRMPVLPCAPRINLEPYTPVEPTTVDP